MKKEREGQKTSLRLLTRKKPYFLYQNKFLIECIPSKLQILRGFWSLLNPLLTGFYKSLL